MPELPEVETTRRGIAPHLINHTVRAMELRERRMRWPIEDDVLELCGQTITAVRRRAKYLLIDSDVGTLILHLGMSGNIRICAHDEPLKKHDHFTLHLDNDLEMRLHDPRRFGAVLWHPATDGDIMSHPRLLHLGPEPLEKAFSLSDFIQSCHGRKTTIKQHIMNNKVVVGVGNIYACEALFRSGIRPTRAAGNISATRLENLRTNIRQVLTDAIDQGGTTLRDFLNQDGKPGYFKQKLDVYDREGKPCHQCGRPIKRITLSGRSTFHCPHCQK